MTATYVLNLTPSHRNAKAERRNERNSKAPNGIGNAPERTRVGRVASHAVMQVSIQVYDLVYDLC